MKVRTTFCQPTLNKPARIRVVDVDSKKERCIPVPAKRILFPLVTICRYAAIEYFGDRYKGALSVSQDGEEYLFEVT